MRKREGARERGRQRTGREKGKGEGGGDGNGERTGDTDGDACVSGWGSEAQGSSKPLGQAIKISVDISRAISCDRAQSMRHYWHPSCFSRNVAACSIEWWYRVLHLLHVACCWVLPFSAMNLTCDFLKLLLQEKRVQRPMKPGANSCTAVCDCTDFSRYSVF